MNKVKKCNECHSPLTLDLRLGKLEALKEKQDFTNRMVKVISDDFDLLSAKVDTIKGVDFLLIKIISVLSLISSTWALINTL